jgi:hypothetical protein
MGRKAARWSERQDLNMSSCHTCAAACLRYHVPPAVTSTGDLVEMGGGGRFYAVDDAVVRLGVSRIISVNQTISVVCSHNGEAGRKSGLFCFSLQLQP